MRHQHMGRKLARTAEHRQALFSNMLASLIMHERIETTDAKAKAIKRLADRTISWGMSVNDILAKDVEKRSHEERVAIVHAIRMAKRQMRSPEALAKLFGEVSLRFRGRTGGYTRVLKTRYRTGDAAPMSFIELTERVAVVAAVEPTVKVKAKAKAAADAGEGQAKAKAKPKAETKAAKAPKGAAQPKAPKGGAPTAKARQSAKGGGSGK